MMEESPFLVLPEVKKIDRISDPTRVRMEERGLYPKRFRIGVRKVAWRKAEIEEWARDPEAWRHRRSTGTAG
jgi:predicted DNA-binding transcriptional regulator AlpA